MKLNLTKVKLAMAEQQRTCGKNKNPISDTCSVLKRRKRTKAGDTRQDCQSAGSRSSGAY